MGENWYHVLNLMLTGDFQASGNRGGWICHLAVQGLLMQPRLKRKHYVSVLT